MRVKGFSSLLPHQASPEVKLLQPRDHVVLQKVHLYNDACCWEHGPIGGQKILDTVVYCNRVIHGLHFFVLCTIPICESCEVVNLFPL